MRYLILFFLSVAFLFSSFAQNNSKPKDKIPLTERNLLLNIYSRNISYNPNFTHAIQKFTASRWGREWGSEGLWEGVTVKLVQNEPHVVGLNISEWTVRSLNELFQVFPYLEELVLADLHSFEISNEDLVYIPKYLKKLTVYFSKGFYKDLEKIQSLEELTLIGGVYSCSDVDDFKYGNITNLNNLRRLRLHDFSIKFMPKMNHTLQKLEEIQIQNSYIRDEEIDVIVGFKNLKVLVIRENRQESFKITTVLPKLFQLKNLKVLDLYGLGMEEALPDISNIPQLFYFNIGKNSIVGGIPDAYINNSFGMTIVSDNSLSRDKTLLYFSSVENLRVRKNDSLEAEVICKLTQNEVVEYVNTCSSSYYEQYINGKLIRAPWFKIRTTNGIVGWVWAGFLKRMEFYDIQDYSSYESVDDKIFEITKYSILRDKNKPTQCGFKYSIKIRNNGARYFYGDLVLYIEPTSTNIHGKKYGIVLKKDTFINSKEEISLEDVETKLFFPSEGEYFVRFMLYENGNQYTPYINNNIMESGIVYILGMT